MKFRIRKFYFNGEEKYTIERTCWFFGTWINARDYGNGLSKLYPCKPKSAHNYPTGFDYHYDKKEDAEYNYKMIVKWAYVHKNKNNLEENIIDQTDLRDKKKIFIDLI